MHNNKIERGFIKLRKGIVQNLHPDLKVLDDTFIPFDGWFNLDLKFFYIDYGYRDNMKAILTHSVKSIVEVIKEYEKDHYMENQ
jgi:hypothetical protein